MEKALELAGKGRSQVSPNPAVGALIVKNGKIIGEGYHQGKGTAHAEIAAIESATEKVEGSTLYCTLEPCSSMYSGKQNSPCTERIVREKISRVVISMIDPNPKVNGRGIQFLQDSGIEVITGILEKKTKILNEVFIKNQEVSLPFVHLKIAQTVDGKIATIDNDSKWITDEEARKDVHIIRSHYDSLLIGSGTVETDNPLLTVRYGIEKKVKRILLNRNLSVSPDSHIFTNQNTNSTCIFCREGLNAQLKEPFRKKGIEIAEIPTDNNGFLDLTIMLREIYRKGITSILVEGGSRIFTSFIKARLFDKFLFI
jgi:diaminohydroxyphosphoribosylaminopyrimidine deaminase/5-amino-6-(5-phosphoribosylamino)uracil reductase